ncbi:MAG: tRNA (N6-isopentenyl adenosine(37)-C2)-methylthiotransferase MiaB [Candidatus Sericytochromatia bacterium]|nr:tRNA (N6-isopentenyl adenosine(37)-C2)-methylthiotransferase MiaB [Candidatus Sericytochromatia bacterium]
MAKKVYIKTYGCQMNQNDTERMLGMLSERGYEASDTALMADLVIVNTCAVREKAEDKLFSLLGELREIKHLKPDAVLAVSGCVAQYMGERMRLRAPHVDLVFGTENIHELPRLLDEVLATRTPMVALRPFSDELPPEMPVLRQGKHSAWVTAIYGCDDRCTYCIVPKVRGDQKSREIADLVREVERVVAEGFGEVVLLGQNINGYGKDLTPKRSLADLIEATAAVPGVKRVRWLTGHPRDLDEDLVRRIAALPNVCDYFHIPIQHGDDDVLRQMARGYTRSKYVAKVEMIRSILPEAGISTDLIVGFPGETEEQFQQTVSIVREMRFAAVNTAAYSPRPGTYAATRQDQVPEEVKDRRLRELNAVVNEVATTVSRAMVGSLQEVFVEGPSSKDPNIYTGRARNNRVVFFEASPQVVGELVQVRITEARTWTIRGELVQQPEEAPRTLATTPR